MKFKLTALLAGLPLGLAMAEPAAFWWAESMSRISRESPPRPAEEIQLYACRNSTEAVQLVFTGSLALQKASGISLSKWSGPASPASPTTQLFQERYVRITQSSPHAPLPPGDYPDPLTPSAKGIYTPLPTDPAVPEGMAFNQPWWLDVEVPPSATPGIYRASATVESNGDHRSIPFTLTVWPITLPDRPTLRSDFSVHWRRVAEIHHVTHDGQSARLRDLTGKYQDMLAAHHLTPEPLDPTLEISDDGTIRKLPVSDYEYRFLHQHATSLPLPMSASWPFAEPLGRDRERTLRYLESFMREMKQHGWASFCYLDCPVDEPDSADAYDQVRAWGRLCHDASQRCGIRIPLLCTEQPAPTNPAWGTLAGAVDIWVPYLGELWKSPNQPDPLDLLRKRQAAGEELWTYVAMVQYPKNFLRNASDRPLDHHPPAWLLDFAPMNFRITAWLCAANNWKGLLYWDTIHWPAGRDPWSDPATFREGKTVYNGDGCLLYPTPEGPVPSMRLKWLRASFEDHALIQLARDAGLATFADSEVRGIARGVADWDADPAALLAARMRIGEELSHHLNEPLSQAPSDHTPASAGLHSR